MNLNTPLWNPHAPSSEGAFVEVWHLKLNDPASQRALWLRFTLLVSRNGFRRVAETWAALFQRDANREITKTVLKQTHDISAFQPEADGAFSIGECRLVTRPVAGTSTGTIRSKGNTLEWDLRFAPRQEAQFNLMPQALTRLGIVKNTAITVGEDLDFNGSCRLNGQEFHWKNARGMQSHLSGPRYAHSWTWGHCNSFLNEQGQPVPFVFEGLTARSKLLSSLSAPELSSFFFLYNGKPYAFNSLWTSIRSKSHSTLTEWHFRADRDDLSFRGSASAEHKDFVGLTYEDTDGGLLFCANSKLSELKIHVYRREKLEATFHSNGTAALEFASRAKNPYVPLVV